MNVLPFDLSNARTFVALVLLVTLLLWETFHPFFAFFKNRGGERLRHGTRNLLLGGANILLQVFGFAALWAWAAHWAEANQFGLLNWTGLGLLSHAVMAVLLLDLWTYGWHWLNHRVSFFWRFHTVHHSDPWMDVTTANRFHLGEILFSSALRIPVILLLGAGLWELALYELLMFAVVQFHHANIALSRTLERALRVFIPTPEMHKVHHSRERAETNSNYSSLFSIWDRLFGTFRLRRDPRAICFGVEGFDDPAWHNVDGMLRTPFRRPESETKSELIPISPTQSAEPVEGKMMMEGKMMDSALGAATK